MGGVTLTEALGESDAPDQAWVRAEIGDLKTRLGAEEWASAEVEAGRWIQALRVHTPLAARVKAVEPVAYPWFIVEAMSRSTVLDSLHRVVRAMRRSTGPDLPPRDVLDALDETLSRAVQKRPNFFDLSLVNQLDCLGVRRDPFFRLLATSPVPATPERLAVLVALAGSPTEIADRRLSRAVFDVFEGAIKVEQARKPREAGKEKGQEAKPERKIDGKK